jgi:CHAT domain-containing protein
MQSGKQGVNVVPSKLELLPRRQLNPIGNHTIRRILGGRTMACLKFAPLPALLAALVLPSQAVLARETPSASERFSIGTSGSVCEAQGVSMGDARTSIYERKWMILCRDIARPVGSAFALRGGDPITRTATGREEVLDCGAAANVAIDGAGNVAAADCRGQTSGLAWKVYNHNSGGAIYVVEGLAGYDSALRLAMANLVADKVVPGTVEVANLGTSDPIALARARAAVSDVDTLIGQGYRGNSSGAYAEAAELFAAAPALLSSDASENDAKLHEMKVNRALQLSNLGAFDQSARLFVEARDMGVRDPVQLRLGRNFEAIDAINRGDASAIPAILDRPMPPMVAPSADASDGSLRIDNSTAAAINAASGATLASVLGQETRLSPSERAMILDAQALQLRGTALRLQGNTAAARQSLDRAYADAMRVRNGKVVSIMRLRSQILSETALTYEAEGRAGEAEALLHQAINLVETQYPESASVNAARARLAGFLYRHNRKPEAADIYRSITANVAGSRSALVGMANMMQPYFDLLTEGSASSPQSVEDLFLAAQLVERPGAADTLAQLSRRLEGGDSRSSDLFRQSLALNREIERSRMRITQAEATGDAAALAEEQSRQKRLLDAQLQLMSSLAEFPQYRAVANRYVTLDELRSTLQPGEAYLKMVQLGGAAYAVYVSPSTAKGWRIDKSVQEIAESVAALRDSISVTVNGVRSTYPFDVDAALALHDALLGPVAAELPSVRHLVFEPDGALLQLPINLLTGDRAGAAAYRSRVDAGGDEFDFTRANWLGRDRAISTALSAASFRDARQAPASKATLSYLGLGHNAPLGPVSTLPSVRSVSGGSEPGCEWPAAAWNSPISATELQAATGIFGRSSSELMTGPAFTDTAIIERPDLASFRIVHFATHGLVTAPRDGCPARPALLTSFGDGQSDGLLGFGEIFNLSLDADLVILSACDTAGQASLEATLEAGVTTGGGQALDGLVRAFIAAGGRQVIASHWPAPDDYNATQRLFSGFFADNGGTVGDALLQAQRGLMDDPATSHPFYWAGFAIIGDGAKPLPSR